MHDMAATKLKARQGSYTVHHKASDSPIDNGGLNTSEPLQNQISTSNQQDRELYLLTVFWNDYNAK